MEGLLWRWLFWQWPLKEEIFCCVLLAVAEAGTPLQAAHAAAVGVDTVDTEFSDAVH
jgi:hypothetical protein